MPDIDDLDIGNEEADEVLPVHLTPAGCACIGQAFSCVKGALLR